MLKEKQNCMVRVTDGGESNANKELAYTLYVMATGEGWAGVHVICGRLLAVQEWNEKNGCTTVSFCRCL